MKSPVYLIGVGMGDSGTLTADAADAIDACDLLVGAPRLLEPWQDKGKETQAIVPAQEIADCILSQDSRCTVGVLLSGDVGFYSGAKNLYPLLEEEREVIAIPGISSLVYFCARIHTAWQDAHLVSAHGRSCDAAAEVGRHAKTFFLTGGDNGPAELCARLRDRGLGQVSVWVGERLSYEDERITYGTAQELAEDAFDPLAVMLAVNPSPDRGRAYIPTLADEDFIRGDVPMTKEEVRALALVKLRLEPGQKVWDVGAGTGSVSVECARSIPDGDVFAIEKSRRRWNSWPRTRPDSACPISTWWPARPRLLWRACPPPIGYSWAAPRAAWGRFWALCCAGTPPPVWWPPPSPWRPWERPCGALRAWAWPTWRSPRLPSARPELWAPTT